MMSMRRRLQPAASSSRISPASSSEGTPEPPGATETEEAEEAEDAAEAEASGETERSPSRNRRDDKISSRTRLGVLYRGPRSRYSARSRASVARRATYPAKSSPPVVSSQRRRSEPTVAGSPTSTVARPGWRARIRRCCRSLGWYGSCPGSTSPSRAARRPPRSSGSHATRTGTSRVSSPDSTDAGIRLASSPGEPGEPGDPGDPGEPGDLGEPGGPR